MQAQEAKKERTDERSKPTTVPPPLILRRGSRLLRRRSKQPPIETTTDRNPQPIETHQQGRRLSRSRRRLLRMVSSSPAVEGSKPTTDRTSSLVSSSVFSRLHRQKKDQNPPRTKTVSVLTASPLSSLSPDEVSSVASRLLRQKNPPRTTSVSVLIKAAIPSSLYFSVRRQNETTTEIDSLGLHHGVDAVFSLLLRQKTDLFNFEITSEVVNVSNFGSVFLVLS